ncbi:MAG: TetM/TetW/TetO/TetS family tetracycline resistance ribosomal protection protein [Clostridia bacterium]|nr:TetM/TetW/TetO/TetS family tetracycline resistance ribosomal protection protein [Clostridia bacterium]
MRRNFGIFAHVDAGKTTLSEQILLHTGVIRTAGRVDKGNTYTDRLDVERRRGISVKAMCVRIPFENAVLHLIDTPGHADFSAEIERSLWALDGAVLVLSGVEGVQPQTEVLFSLLRSHQIPVILFVNKMDREGADRERVLGEIRKVLTECAAPMDDPEGMLEAMSGASDVWLSRYLEGDIPEERACRDAFEEMAREGKVYPVLFGSALQGQGVEALLHAIVTCLPEPDTAMEARCGVVFALTRDRLLGSGAVVRLFGGCLQSREEISLPVKTPWGETRYVTDKITQIRDLSGRDTGKAEAGDIAVIFGLSHAKVGTVIGDEKMLPSHVQSGRLRTPIMTVQVIPEKPEDMEKVRLACEALSREDPLLEAHYIRSLEEEHIQVMGEIHAEILQEELRTRFSLNVTMGEASLLYRETIRKETVGFVAYTMPKPCWAVIRLDMKPLPPGSGVVFHSTVPVRRIQERYQHQVEQALPMALSQGRLGWPVTDVDITLSDGSDHQFHTHPLDFIVATPMAVQDGLQRGGSVLLEPILEMHCKVPPEHVGRITSDVMRMRGTVVSTQSQERYADLVAEVPASESLHYARELASLTGGRGSMSVRIARYAPAPDGVTATRHRDGVDPLDQSRYILAARHALDSDIFDT